LVLHPEKPKGGIQCERFKRPRTCETFACRAAHAKIWAILVESGLGEVDKKTAREQLNKKTTSGFYPISTMGLFCSSFSGPALPDLNSK